MKEYMETQKDFADRIEVHSNHYNKYEQGKVYPSLPIALKIASKLSKKVDDIWQLDE